MSLPKKKIKYTHDINPPKVGYEYLKYGFDRIEELMNQTDEKTKYLPRTILFEDLDDGMYEYVNSGKMKLIVDGEKVPVFFLDNERWGELSQTWRFSDDDKNVPTPYITIRRTNKAPGTRMGNKAIVAQQRKFRYLDVPILDEGEVIYLRFKMPEPVNVDFTYEISFFTKYREDVNLYDEKILKLFSSRQDYIFVKKQPIPILLESITEPKSLENIEGDRFLLSQYTIKMLGLIRREEDYEIVKTMRKTKINNVIIR